MEISRHFVDVDGRRVHYRRCGSGPALLMVHQSPRSSAEYADLMLRWGEHFTCIAPDTPGFGQSDPLADPKASIDDFADALAALLTALGLERVPAYGFHSGGIILVTALRRHPDRFSALAIGGYAVWTEEERHIFAERYLPPLRPQPYGQHLTWLWNRMLEQSWFFPWFAVASENRLSGAHADIECVDAAVSEMLDAGDAYRTGYGAVLRAPRDIPNPDAETAPVLITAYDGDPLQAHLDRLGALPVNWKAHAVPTADAHRVASLNFLLGHAEGAECPKLGECYDEGFLHVEAGGFDGLIHWSGKPGDTLRLHEPAAALGCLEQASGLAIDLPGHGLSDAWPAVPPRQLAAWKAVIETVRAHFHCTEILWPTPQSGDPNLLFTDLSPDRFGTHLIRAWGIIRASALFEPWYASDAEHARDFGADDIDPLRLAVIHRARLRASAAGAWWEALQSKEREEDGNS